MARIRYLITNTTEDVSQKTIVSVNRVLGGMRYSVNIDNSALVSYLAEDGDVPSDVVDALVEKLNSERSLSANFTRTSPTDIEFESEFEGREFDLSVQGNGITTDTLQKAEQARPVPLPEDWLEEQVIEPGGSVSRIIEGESITSDQERRLESLMRDGVIEIDRKAIESDASEKTDAFDSSEAKMVYYDSSQSGLSASNVQEAIDEVQSGSIDLSFHTEVFEPNGPNDDSYQLSNTPIEFIISVELNGVGLSEGANNDYDRSNDEIDFLHPLMSGDKVQFKYVTK
jgi:hypothetical protein